MVRRRKRQLPGNTLPGVRNMIAFYADIPCKNRSGEHSLTFVCPLL